MRQELLSYLDQGHTHAAFDDAVADFPDALMNEKIKGVPYSFWQLLEHIRITQHDMLEFMQNPQYQDKEWPKDYWPDPEEIATRARWTKSLEDYKKDLDAIKKIIKDPKNDLSAPISWGKGQTIFREALQVIDHASYHLGEFILMRRIKGEWHK